MPKQAQTTETTATETDAKTDAANLRAIARGERDAAERFFRSIEPSVRSVPIKALSAFRKAYNANPGAKAYDCSTRIAAMLAIASGAQSVAVKPGAKIKRQFDLLGIKAAVENGCTSDGNGSVYGYDPKTETFTLTSAGVEALHGKLSAAQITAIHKRIAAAKSIAPTV